MSTEEQTTSVSASARGMERISFVSEGHAFVDEGTEATDEVHSDCLAAASGCGRILRSPRHWRRLPPVRWGDGDALVDNWDAELSFDTFADADKVCGTAGDLVVNFAAGYFAVGVGAVEQEMPMVTVRMSSFCSSIIRMVSKYWRCA